jgi:succinate dehydrogenase/fumarate reductase flavoprotein subunit
MYASARRRTETRGMHKHEEFTGLDAAQQRCVWSGGLDSVWVRPAAD